MKKIEKHVPFGNIYMRFGQRTPGHFWQYKPDKKSRSTL